MANLEEIDLSRYRREIDEDLRHMVTKYCRIIEWEVPEADEERTKALILGAIKASFAEIEAQA